MDCNWFMKSPISEKVHISNLTFAAFFKSDWFFFLQKSVVFERQSCIQCFIRLNHNNFSQFSLKLIRWRIYRYPYTPYRARIAGHTSIMSDCVSIQPQVSQRNIYCVIKLLHVWKTNFPCVYVCVCCNAKRVGTWPQTSPLSATRASRHQQTPKTNQPERDQQPRSHGARGKFTEGTFKGEGQGWIVTCVTQALRYIFSYFTLLHDKAGISIATRFFLLIQCWC